MPCSDLAGVWIRGFLADDSAEVATIDPVLTIEDTGGGNLRGFFTGETPFPIVCHNIAGRQLRIEFTRTHAGAPATQTNYQGRAVSFSPRAMFGIIKGRFRREVTQSGRVTVTTGDWETEKPT